MAMNKQLVFAKNGSLFLNTSISADSFAKSRISERLHQTGYSAQKNGTMWHFSPWAFTGTQEETSTGAGVKTISSVLLEGPAPHGKTLKNYIDLDFSKKLTEEEKATVSYVCALVCTVISAACEQEISLPRNGGGGIFIADDFSTVIFLPEELFGNAISCAGEPSLSEYHGMYVQPQLKGDAALHFMQSVIAYRALTGTFPFASTDTTKRKEDYLDHNYVPLKNAVWALDEKLVFFIDNALKRSPRIIVRKKSVLHDGRSINERITESIKDTEQAAQTTKTTKTPSQSVHKLHFPLQELYRELGLSADGNIPPEGILSDVIRKASISQEQFEKEAHKERLSFLRTLSIKRWVRHNSTALAIVLVAVFSLSAFMLIYAKGRASHPTSKGLTAFETTEMFYSALNNLDILGAQGSSSGSSVNPILETISAVYVASKTRSAYTPLEKTVSPAEWMNTNYDGKYNIFGLTQFTIFNTKGSLFAEGNTQAEHPRAITEEDGEPIKEGHTKTVAVSYYFVFNDSPEELSVLLHNDNVTLRYHKNRWVVTDIEQHEVSQQSVPFAEFREDYKQTFSGKDKNVLETANLLRDKYKWISTNSEILEAAHKSAENMQ